ncbi:MAG: formyltransferase family protein, partial [Flavobacteriaceae bacterium]|nr:formyltransferase family protein [Flavobacteriaceae bacterium]
IPGYSFNRSAYEAPDFLNFLNSFKPDLIVLAGFLWKITSGIVEAFPQKIINIHPALLPNFGGKGMYGMHIHRAVIERGVKETGITIHYVNEAYDEGEVLLQKQIKVFPEDTPSTLAARVLNLEHKTYSKLIEQLLTAP